MIVDNIQHHTAQQAGANGLQITYDSFGNPSDPVMILIMGLGTHMIHWSDQFCQLLASNKLRVIRFDNRGQFFSNLLCQSLAIQIGRGLVSLSLSHSLYQTNPLETNGRPAES